MIIKDRKVPISILTLRALLRRLPQDHPKKGRIDEELKKGITGFRGEQAIEYYLTFLSKGKYFIFHDIRIKGVSGHYFQIDTLIISSQFALILEVKNIQGTLIFDQNFHQLIRKINDHIDSYPDPILQIERQKQQLELWLKANQYSALPVLTFVVISKSSSTIETAPPNKEVYQKVIRAEAIPHKVKLLENKYKNDFLNQKQLKRLTRILLKEHTPIQIDILNHFQIQKSEIIFGVNCFRCNMMPLTKSKSGWYCPQCNSTHKTSHIQTLMDYYLLIGPTITNQQFRDFLVVSSRFVANKILKSLNLPHTGTYKNRTYTLDLSALEEKLPVDYKDLDGK